MNIRSDLGWEKYLKPFLYKRLPDGTGWSAVLGTMCALTFMLLVVTGSLLVAAHGDGVDDPDQQTALQLAQGLTQRVFRGRVSRMETTDAATALVRVAGEAVFRAAVPLAGLEREGISLSREVLITFDPGSVRVVGRPPAGPESA